MPSYTTINTITAALNRFNKRAHNAGLSFKVEQTGKNEVNVIASFDFAYYVNVRINFSGVAFSQLMEKDGWPDAWHADQLFC